MSRNPRWTREELIYGERKGPRGVRPGQCAGLKLGAPRSWRNPRKEQGRRLPPKTTSETPAFLARSAINFPISAAAPESAPVLPDLRKSASSVDAEARVRPCASSMSWTEMFFDERDTDRRGLPFANLRRRLRTRCARRLVLSREDNMAYFFLPSFRRTCSPAKRMPLPL